MKMRLPSHILGGHGRKFSVGSKGGLEMRSLQVQRPLQSYPCSRADPDHIVSESEARYAQYLRYQDDREARRRLRTDEDIAKRLPSQRQTALDSEQQLRRSYDQRRDAFIARYRAAVAGATCISGL